MKLKVAYNAKESIPVTIVVADAVMAPTREKRTEGNVVPGVWTTTLKSEAGLDEYMSVPFELEEEARFSLVVLRMERFGREKTIRFGEVLELWQGESCVYQVAGYASDYFRAKTGKAAVALKSVS